MTIKEMTIKDANAVKKWRSCLRCGKMMLTDRCHRICKKCHRRNNATHDKDRVRVSSSRSKYFDADFRF